MRNSKWTFTAALLVSVSAAAQQPVESRQPAPASTSQISPMPASDVVQPAAQPAAQTEVTSAAATPPTPQQVSATAPAPSALAQPVTMDQVVDRFIEREHDLMKALSNRTPVVETYL